MNGKEESGKLAYLVWLVLVLIVGLASFGAGSSAQDLPSMYAIDFLGTASRGEDMNDQGEVVGVRSIDIGCGSRCLAPTEEVVWSGEEAIPLPYLPAWDAIFVEGISASGWVVGTAYDGPIARAAVWKKVAGGYQAIELGTLPGMESSRGIDIDVNNRALGYSSSIFPPAGAPFTWTEAGGLTDLTTLGFPSYEPRTMSPGGTVAYVYGWYELDVPGVVHQNAPAPPGFRTPSWYAAINDAGDQIRLLGPTSGQNLHYLFRYYNHGDWQQLWPIGGHDGSPFGVGSITSNLDVTATISSTGLLAPGPGGVAEDLTQRLSPAYGDAYVTEGGPINESGDILGQVTIGRSPRLVRLVAAAECTTGCIRVSALELTAKNPRRCNSGSLRAQVSLQITDEAGSPLRGVQVAGRFLDNYWLDGVRQGTTDRKGKVRFSHNGPPCVGAVSFLVTNASAAGRTFDRTLGTLQGWVIPE
jgi:hypothetical protein